MTLSIGIIGAGRLGSFHADKIASRDDVRLVGVCDSVAAARDSLSAKHKTTSFAEVESLVKVCDAVIIAAPTCEHYNLGEVALRQGVHVLMEKPLATTSGDSHNLATLARRYGKVLQVGHVEAFSPVWTALLESQLGADIRAGQPTILRAVRTSPYTFRSTDIGATLDIMVHDLDLVLSLIPARLERVEAMAMNVIGEPHQGGHEDIVDARLFFSDRSVATFHTSRVESRPQRTMEIKTSTGSASLDFATRRLEMKMWDEAVRSGAFAPQVLKTTDPLTPALLEPHTETTVSEFPAVDALALELDDFVRACRGECSPRVSGARGAVAVSVAEAIIATATAECRVRTIKIPIAA
ncbi:MAG: Gfo/Idh/MocA family oxidoreductase [Thermoguttaceae bacterium]